MFRLHLRALAWPLAFLPLLVATAARPEVRFREASADWGLDFVHHHGGSGELFMIETMGSGVVVFDYDGDGDQDLALIDSGPTPGYEGPAPRSALYRNDGDGRFVDASDEAGFATAPYGMGGTAGDVDGDGDLDLYVTHFGANQLFVNQGDGTFVETGVEAGVADPAWGASAALADVDRDGDLDLYVTNYVDFTYDNNQICGDKTRNLRSYCHPDSYNGLPDRFFSNRGDGTFDDATAAAGFSSATGNGLGVVFADLDLDGWTDLYVANDMTANLLFRNRRDGTFAETGLESAVAFGERGDAEAGMGIAVGDLDGDGFPEILVTHLDLQTNALYSFVGGGLFVDKRFPSRLAEPSLYRVGFGTAFADLDHDGDLDALVANGHIVHNVDDWGRGTTYKQPNQVFVNTGGGRFAEAKESGIDRVRSSRGLALGDLDGDGDLDVVITNSNDRAEVYENLGAAAAAWLAVDLAGVAGIGARLDLEGGGRRQRREVRTASSYLSQSALTAHFGLGAAERVDALAVAWSDGRRQRYEAPPRGRRLTLFAPAPRGRSR